MLLRLLRRRRRALAAVAAFLAVVVLVPVLRPPAPAAPPPPDDGPAPGRVAMPVPVTPVGGLVAVGDRIDLLGATGDGSIVRVARDATVLASTVDGGSPLLLVGIDERETIPVARAMTVNDLVVVVHPARSAG